LYYDVFAVARTKLRYRLAQCNGDYDNDNDGDYSYNQFHLAPTHTCDSVNVVEWNCFVLGVGTSE